ncbi:unnamed protein product, partial [Aureobasidium mustum]
TYAERASPAEREKAETDKKNEQLRLSHLRREGITGREREKAETDKKNEQLRLKNDRLKANNDNLTIANHTLHHNLVAMNTNVGHSATCASEGEDQLSELNMYTDRFQEQQKRDEAEVAELKASRRSLRASPEAGSFIALALRDVTDALRSDKAEVEKKNQELRLIHLPAEIGKKNQELRLIHLRREGIASQFNQENDRLQAHNDKAELEKKNQELRLIHLRREGIASQLNGQPRLKRTIGFRLTTTT